MLDILDVGITSFVDITNIALTIFLFIAVERNFSSRTSKAISPVVALVSAGINTALVTYARPADISPPPTDLMVVKSAAALLNIWTFIGMRALIKHHRR